ncbi:MAG: acetate kinase [Spirulinaceae cyanobacterium SM2_1_0]|nr:acetate kinase [Spirulinaceae cyanobacterium SM2_1_0]
MKVLVLNAGSSSHKSYLYELTGPLPPTPPTPLWQATIDWSGGGQLVAKANQARQERHLTEAERPRAIAHLIATLTEGNTAVLENWQEIAIVGHRVVHGGADYSQPTRIDADVKATIRDLCTLAPAHNPVNLAGIEAIEQLLGDVPQLAVFDTAFHQQMPAAARTYPLPYEWVERGIRRYGFHGISHEYCSQRAAQLLDKPLDSLRLITCHLGNGCSLAAVQEGHSIDTTMGFTPLEGLMMGSRSGSIDPAIALYLQRQHDFTPDQVDRLLNKESGLKGIAGGDGDLRAVLAGREQGDERAQLAFAMYVHSLRRQIGAMLGVLGGLEALVFAGGIGENSPDVRAAACGALEFLGLRLDAAANQDRPRDRDIALPDSTVRVLVIATAEDWAIAQACHRYWQAELA